MHPAPATACRSRGQQGKASTSEKSMRISLFRRAAMLVVATATALPITAAACSSAIRTWEFPTWIDDQLHLTGPIKVRVCEPDGTIEVNTPHAANMRRTSGLGGITDSGPHRFLNFQIHFYDNANCSGAPFTRRVWTHLSLDYKEQDQGLRRNYGGRSLAPLFERAKCVQPGFEWTLVNGRPG
jgi:hypothetical protein